MLEIISLSQIAPSLQFCVVIMRFKMVDKNHEVDFDDGKPCLQNGMTVFADFPKSRSTAKKGRPAHKSESDRDIISAVAGA